MSSFLVAEASAGCPQEEWGLWPVSMAPSVDGEFLPEEPAVLLREGRYNMVDVMAGVVEHEGEMFKMSRS